MPTVAIVGTRGYPSYYGGFETLVRHLAPYLADSGWRIRVYSRPGAVRADDIKRDRRIIVTETKGINSQNLSTLSFGLTASLHALTHKPDVALVMNVANGFYLPLLSLRGVPTVVNVDGIEWERDKWGGTARSVFKAGAWLTSKFASRLVMDAHAITDYWRKHLGRGGTYIPYGAAFYDEDLPLVTGLEHRGYVLLVARLVPENTVPEFAQAVETIAKHAPVVIVGSTGYGGPLDETMATLAARHDKVQWLGQVADDAKLHSLWQHCGVYFHGHSVGGTNPALVQAMALGAPIIARDTVFNREVLGDAGTFVPVNPGAIAEATLTLLSDPARQEDSSRRVMARAKSEYTWDLVNEQYDKLLRASLK